MTCGPGQDPVDRVEWRDADELDGNLWNPNVVASPEFRLLELSILRNGWIQPVLVNRTGIIIDGFHRWTLARESKALRERYGKQIPCTVLDVPDDEAMLITIRMNRAKGAHVATRMHEIVRRLLHDHGYAPEQVAREMGATLDEVTLLDQEGVFKARDIPNHRYSRAWYPAEEAAKRGD